MMPHFVRRGTSGTPSPTQESEWDVYTFVQRGTSAPRSSAYYVRTPSPTKFSLPTGEKGNVFPYHSPESGFVFCSLYIELLP